MRILLLAQWYEPVVGGEEIQVRTLAHALARRGHRVTIAAMAHPERPTFYLDGPVRVHRLRASVQSLPWLFAAGAQQSAPPLPDPGLSSSLRRLVKRERPDVVHAHNWMVYSYIATRDKSIPLVMTLHDMSRICAKKDFLYQGKRCDGPGPVKCTTCTAGHYGPIKGPVTLGGLWGMNALFARNVSRYIAVSHAVAERSDLAKAGLPYMVIPNFLPDTYFDPQPEASTDSLRHGAFILFAGALRRVKGINELLSAYAQLPEAQRPPLVLMGYTGSEGSADLERLPPGVSVIVNQSRSAVHDAMRQSLFVVVPSIWEEAFGLVALEAMAAGRPVIASRIGGLKDIVDHGKTGLLVEPGDIAALTAAMSTLISDPDQRATFGQNARVAASRFSEARIVPQIESVYSSLLERAQAPATA